MEFVAAYFTKNRVCLASIIISLQLLMMFIVVYLCKPSIIVDISQTLKINMSMPASNDNNTMDPRVINGACKIILAPGTDPDAALTTLVFEYPVNFLIHAEKHGYVLWINYTKEMNKLYTSPDVNKITNLNLKNVENVFEYYYEGITPESQGCDLKKSKIVYKWTFPEVLKNLHYNMEYPYIAGWYYRFFENGIEVNNEYYNETWYAQQRVTGYKYVSKYFKLRKELKDEVDNIWVELFGEDHNKYFILGVQMRGTDKGAWRRGVSADEYMEYIVKFMRYYKHRGKIFIATDDQRLYNSIKNDWRVDGWSFDDVVRSQTNIARSNNDIAIFEMNVNKYITGKECLFDVLLLAKCRWFIHSASQVAESVFYNNIQLHNHSIHLEYTQNRQIPFWAK